MPVAVEVGGNGRPDGAPGAAVDVELQGVLVGHLQRVLAVALGDDREVAGPVGGLDPGVEREAARHLVELAVAVDLHEVVQATEFERFALGSVHMRRFAGEPAHDAVGVVRGGVEGERDVLLGPVPDEAALHLRVGAHDVPELLEVAQTVAHRVRVLAHDDRLGSRLRLGFQPGGRRVARPGHVRERRVTVGHVRLVVERAVVVLPRVLGHRVVRLAESRLVPGVPHDDAGVVLVPLHHADEPVLERVLPLREFRQTVVRAAVVVVRLDVDLVGDHQAVAVGQVVEVRVTRVVRGAHGVDVEPLHQRDVLLLLGAGDVPAAVDARLGAVGASEHHAPTVDLQLLVADLDLPEADGLLAGLDDLAVPEELYAELVDVRGLVGPLQRVRDPAVDDRHLTALRVEELGTHGVARLRAADDDVGFDCRVAVLRVQVGPDRDVLEVRPRRPVEPDLAEDAGEPPLVVVLQVCAGAPAVHLDPQRVRPGLEPARDVELRRRVAALVVADVGVVDPDEVSAGHALEAEQRAVPRVR